MQYYRAGSESRSYMFHCWERQLWRLQELEIHSLKKKNEFATKQAALSAFAQFSSLFGAEISAPDYKTTQCHSSEDQNFVFKKVGYLPTLNYFAAYFVQTTKQGGIWDRLSDRGHIIRCLVFKALHFRNYEI
jgi:hypothetical protein